MGVRSLISIVDNSWMLVFEGGGRQEMSRTTLKLGDLTQRAWFVYPIPGHVL